MGNSNQKDRNQTRDHELGMDHDITRRDFLNGVAIGAGGLLASSWLPGMLAAETAATGHGIPMSGEPLRQQLRTLAKDFDRVGLPRKGRYVHQPAIVDHSGVVSLPPPIADPLPKVMALSATALGVMAVLSVRKRRRKAILRTAKV